MPSPDSLRLVEIHLTVAVTTASEAVGWAAVLRADGVQKVLRGAYPSGGGRVGEIKSLTETLNALRFPCQVILQANMPQLRQGLANLTRWESAGWLTATGNPVPAASAWRDLREAMARHHLLFIWAPLTDLAGHAAEEAAAVALAQCRSSGTGHQIAP